MLHISIPAREEFLQLAELRSDICVSIYLKTSPRPQEAEASRIELGNQIKAALIQLQDRSVDKRRISALEDEISGILDDDDFWSFHASSLAVLATPDCIRTYRMANEIGTRVEIGDRFYLKPLLRAMTFPYAAYILALSENGVRLVEMLSGTRPEVVKVPGMPKDAASSVGKSKLTASLDGMTHESGSRGRKMHLAQYSRKVNDALRPVLMHGNMPVFLVSTDPLASVFRSVSSLPLLAEETVFTGSDHLNLTELVDLVRPLLDRHNSRAIVRAKELFALRSGQGRGATDLADVAKAVTYGAASMLLVDFDSTERGTISDSGELTFSDGPESYNIVDEIAKRALAGGAEIMALRKDEMGGTTGIAAVLRYSLQVK